LKKYVKTLIFHSFAGFSAGGGSGGTAEKQGQLNREGRFC